MSNISPDDLRSIEVTIAGAGTTYSWGVAAGAGGVGKTLINRAISISKHIFWDGTLAGALTFWTSNNRNPDPVNDDDWVQLVLEDPPADPAGAPGKAFVVFPFFEGLHLRTKFVQAAGAGDLTEDTFVKLDE